MKGYNFTMNVAFVIRFLVIHSKYFKYIKIFFIKHFLIGYILLEFVMLSLCTLNIQWVFTVSYYMFRKNVFVLMRGQIIKNQGLFQGLFYVVRD